jgi:hypothetical protein
MKNLWGYVLMAIFTLAFWTGVCWVTWRIAFELVKRGII